MKAKSFKLICIALIAVFFMTATVQAQTKTPPAKAATEKSAAEVKKEQKKEKKKEKKAKKAKKKAAKKAAKLKAGTPAKN